MAQAVKEIRSILEAPKVTKYNWLQRYALLRSHPRKIYFDMAAMIWVVNYLWQGRWGVALSLYLLVNIATLIAVSDSDTDQMAETLYGKIVLLHVRPTNLFFHLLGYVGLIQGLLTHSTQSILLGISSVLIGHLVGWNEVHPSFRSGK
jgi:hypothetical protein